VSHRCKTDWYHLNALKALKRNLGMRQAVEIACPEWSFSDVVSRSREVRFAPLNRPRQLEGLRPKSANDRDRGEPRGSAPPTPPYVRVRIRRFEKLR
jgi:hypothetical protein